MRKVVSFQTTADAIVALDDDGNLWLRDSPEWCYIPLPQPDESCEASMDGRESPESMLNRLLDQIVGPEFREPEGLEDATEDAIKKVIEWQESEGKPEAEEGPQYSFKTPAGQIFFMKMTQWVKSRNSMRMDQLLIAIDDIEEKYGDDHVADSDWESAWKGFKRKVKKLGFKYPGKHLILKMLEDASR